MQEKLFVFAKKIWSEGFYFTERGQSLIKTKCELYNLDSGVISLVDSRISLLQDALDYLIKIAGNDGLNEFAIEEIEEFCEIKGCTQDIEIILNVYRNISSSVKSSEEDNKDANDNYAIQVVEDQKKSSDNFSYDTGSSNGGNRDESIKNDNIIWVEYKSNIDSSIRELDKSLNSVSRCAELVDNPIEKRINFILGSFEEFISGELINRGYLESPEPHFKDIKNNLLSFVSSFTNELSHAVSANNRQIQIFKNLNQGSGGIRGSGSLGFMAGVAVVNGIQSMFSGVGRAYENRKFSNDLDENLWSQIQPVIKIILEGVIDVLVDYYDLLSVRIGLLSFNEMATAFSKAEYILVNLEKITDPGIRLEAIKRAFNTFPFQGHHWLKLIGESMDVPENSLELIKMATPFYIGGEGDLKCIEYQIHRNNGDKKAALTLSSFFNGNKEIDLSISGNTWPINSTKLSTVEKIELDGLLLSNSLDQFVNDRFEDLDLICDLFRKNNKDKYFKFLFVDLILAIVDNKFARAREIGASLIDWTDNIAQKKYLLAICGLDFISTNGKVSSLTFDKFTESIGLKADQTIKYWSGTGGEFYLMESFKLFIEGKKEEALECIDEIDANRFGKCWSNIIEWPYKTEFEDLEFVRAGQTLYVEYLREKAWLCVEVPGGVFSMLRQTLNKSFDPTAWAASVAQSISAYSKSDSIGLNLALQAFKSSANREMMALINAVELSATLNSGNEDDLEELVEKTLNNSFGFDEISKNWDCSLLKEYFDKKIDERCERLTPWSDKAISKVYGLLPNIIKDKSLQRLVKPSSVALEVCRVFTEQVPGSSDKINPNHLISYWSSEKSFGIILSYSFFFINKKNNMCYEVYPFSVKKSDEYGWVNTYVRIYHSDSELEIPFHVSGYDRGNIDAVFTLIEEISKAWIDSAEEKTWDDIRSIPMERMYEIYKNSSFMSYGVIELQSDLNLFETEAEDNLDLEKETDVVGSFQVESECDNFINKEVEVIHSLIRQAIDGNKTDESIKVWFAPDINMQKAGALIKKIGNLIKIRQSDIVCYYDETVFGSGDDGILITDNHVIFCPYVGDQKVIELSSIKKISIGGILNRALKIEAITETYQAKMTGSNKGTEKIYEILKRYVDMREAIAA